MPNDLTRDIPLGIYEQQLARDIARYYRSMERVGLPSIARQPPSTVPFQAVNEVEQGQIVQFRDEFVSGFGERTSDAEIAYFKNHTLMKAGLPETDADFDHLRRRTWGVSISDVLPDRDGIAIVGGPACIECVLGTATASAVGNFIVPWTDKEKGGKGEVRPYGIARCIEQDPELEGWRWVIMGDAKWNFFGRTSAAHNKAEGRDVKVYFGPKGSETDTGLTQWCWNHFADLDNNIRVKGEAEYNGFDLYVAECV